jgi:hypothetical protein
MNELAQEADRGFNWVMWMIGAILVIAVIVYGAWVLYGVISVETHDPNVIFSNDRMETRAVCTEGSGIIVTTVFNARIAGDEVASVRMTDEEWRTYCGAESDDETP